MPPTVKKHQLQVDKLQDIISHGFQSAAKGFSGMIGQSLHVANPYVKAIPFKDIPNVLGGPENEAVGIYLRVEGEIEGQIIIILPLPKAMELADMLLENEPGTTQKLGTLERSALAEVGNLTGTFFLNAVAELTGISSRPTPPAVMVDMVGSILDVVIATMGSVQSEILMFQTDFVFGNRQTEANFWIVPNPDAIELLSKAGK